MTVYQIEVPDELWHDWKLTVPRDKKLNSRIIELIEQDLDK